MMTIDSKTEGQQSVKTMIEQLTSYVWDYVVNYGTPDRKAYYYYDKEAMLRDFTAEQLKKYKLPTDRRVDQRKIIEQLAKQFQLTLRSDKLTVITNHQLMTLEEALISFYWE